MFDQFLKFCNTVNCLLFIAALPFDLSFGISHARITRTTGMQLWNRLALALFVVAILDDEGSIFPGSSAVGSIRDSTITGFIGLSSPIPLEVFHSY